MKKIILFLITLFWMPLVFADTAATQALMAELAKLQSAQGNFQQMIKDANGNTIQESRGNFALNRPASGKTQGLFYWNVTSDPQQQLVADGTYFWFYDASLQQVTRQLQSAVATQNSPAMLLSGDLAKISAQYNITMNTSVASQTFTLTPLKGNNSFTQLVIIFSHGSLSKMQAVDALGNHTEIDFSKITSPAPANLFVFKRPARAEVVEA